MENSKNTEFCDALRSKEHLGDTLSTIGNHAPIKIELLNSEQTEALKKFQAKKVDSIKFTACILSFTMVVLCSIFLLHNPLYILIPSLIAFAALGITVAWMNATKHESLFKLFFVALCVLSSLGVVYIALSASGVLSRLENPEQIANFIKGLGWIGVFVFILFVVLNTVFLPVPFAIPAVIGTLLYGPLWSFIYMSIGTVVGSIIVFTMGKLFGRRLVTWMIGKERTEKYAAFLDKKGRLAFIFMMIFPFFPDDILCLIAGLTSMSYKYFILVICTVRVGVLAFTCFFADGSIIPFSGWGIPVWIVIGIVFVGVFVAVTLLKRNIMGSTKKV